ncbi:hypothetical protein OIU84_018228 [Salix udensis]|uniref:Uncharacterized protein n=1 Tax=Salix udensis TaxID=889485 RepID=A0AAD6L3Y4_9ROSI|nr:hypothetical protein OIU84_018228 [Salix udensis]
MDSNHHVQVYAVGGRTFEWFSTAKVPSIKGSIAISSLERVAGCKFEFVNPCHQLLKRFWSVTRPAEQMVASVQPESSQFFTPSARKLIGEQRRSALPTRLGHLSENDAHAEGSVYSAAANASHN